MRRLGLRARLVLALVASALLAAGTATLLSNHGLPSRVEEAAEDRLAREATHLAGVAGAFYEEEGRWTPQHVEAVEHLAVASRLRARVVRSADPAPTVREREAAGRILAGGRPVGWVVVAPLGGRLLTPEEEHLRHSLDRLHLAAAAISVLGALAFGFLLAEGLSRPLRRIRSAADRIGAGDLEARVEPGGGPDLEALGGALNRLAETLRQEEELRKQSVADLAHELRTPVGALLSRIEAAQDGVLEPRANHDAMHAEALRLKQLLDDLARLADAEQPGLLIDTEPLDLAALAAEQAELWRPRLAESGLELAVELQPAEVDGDRLRLAQVLANLLSNACRYTERGGRVSLRVRAEGRLAVAEVADTGVGIAEDDLQHVFKRFWRAEKSRSRATGGTGIGLAIVRELVRAHGGTVEVESARGAGSTFRVSLPLLHATSRPPSRALHRSGGHSGR